MATTTEVYAMEVEELKARAFELIREAGGVKAVSDYSGSGDSGSVDDITVYGAEDQPIVRHTWGSAHSELVEIADRLVAEAAGEAWYDGFGGGGTITIDAEAGTVLVEHGDYIEHTEMRDPVTF